MTGLSDRDAWLRWLVVGAVTMWLVSLALYLRAITRSHGEFTPQTANGMLDEFRSYAKNVRASVKRGTYATFVAIAVTVAAALALAADSIIPRAEREVTLALHSDAWRALSQLCNYQAADTLTAEVRPADLGLATVPLRMRCRSQDALEVHMRRDWILAARLIN